MATKKDPKSRATKPKDEPLPEPPPLSAQKPLFVEPAPPPVVAPPGVPLSELERKRVEREIMGLKARLRWAHLDDVARSGYEARIDELREKLVR